jgi:FtsH-binding integral membrane protein
MEYSAQQPYVQPRAQVSTARLLGQVMFLVSVAIGFLALGIYMGRDLALGTATICSFAGLGMLLVASFAPGRLFRVGPFAVVWLYALAVVLGLGLGPVIQEFLSTQPQVVYQAAGLTGLITVGMGAAGFAWDRDLARWMRPLSIIVLGLVVVSIVTVLLGSGANPLLSGAIALVSAALILVDFNFLRKHGTEEHAVMLATGIFVSIINIFISLLNIFSR